MSTNDFLKRLSGMIVEVKCPKNRYNSFGGYHHRSLEDVFDAVKPLMLKYNIHILVTDDLVSLDGHIFVKSTAYAFDILSEQYKSTTAYAKVDFERKKLDSSQLSGVASSYARKYALQSLLCLDDVKDADDEVVSKVLLSQTQTNERQVQQEVKANEKQVQQRQTQVSEKEVMQEAQNVKKVFGNVKKTKKLIRTGTHYELLHEDGKVEKVDVNDKEGYARLLESLKRSVK